VKSSEDRIMAISKTEKEERRAEMKELIRSSEDHIMAIFQTQKEERRAKSQKLFKAAQLKKEAEEDTRKREKALANALAENEREEAAEREEDARLKEERDTRETARMISLERKRVNQQILIDQILSDQLKSPHEVLQVLENATQVEIKNAFHAKAKLIHPHKCSLNNANAAMQVLNNVRCVMLGQGGNGGGGGDDVDGGDEGW
jgi:hypothetical protein